MEKNSQNSNFKCGNRKETLNFASECGLKCKGGRAKTNLS